MAKSAERSTFAAFLAEELQPLGPVEARRMFSGAGLFCDGLMFAIIVADVLYLKADDESRGRFEAEGAPPFQYPAKGGRVSLNYWRAPERLLDDPEELIAWSRAALAVARRKAASKVKTRSLRPAKGAKSAKPVKTKGKSAGGPRAR
ncbi:MAG: TfoX family protein [Hyphomicrobiales bacterium]|nr:MAG: TfoX family protein [Hyphomicrobiales bacterium]